MSAPRPAFRFPVLSASSAPRPSNRLMKFFGFGNDPSRGKGPLPTVLEGREDEALLVDQEARTQNYGDHLRSLLGAAKGRGGGSSTSVFNSSHVSIDSTLLFRVSHLSCCALLFTVPRVGVAFTRDAPLQLRSNP
eukprot:826988-Prorocentrum_minimum.AAC.1